MNKAKEKQKAVLRQKPVGKLHLFSNHTFDMQ